MAFDFFKMTSSRPPRPIVVAEIGTSHGGSLERGLDLVDAAAEAGADVAKVQVVFADEILPPEAGLVPLPGGDVPLFDVFRSLERPPDFYAAMAGRAEKRGIGFLASPFGERSVALLESIGAGAWKVASPELNHEDLLERLARTGLPLILSTGVSTHRDIARALEVIRGTSGAPENLPVVLLHCLTSYPAPENEANLLLLPVLEDTYALLAGISDHSLDPVLIPALAAALGAVLVEKHITLDRSAGGLDDPVALTPDAFARMCAAVRRFALPPGSPRDRGHLKKVTEELADEYGMERVISALGDGVKRLAASESANYGRTNRSIHAVGALKKGTRLTPENTAVLRTEKVLRPGIEPRFRREIYGRTLVRDVPAGEGILWPDLGETGL